MKSFRDPDIFKEPKSLAIEIHKQSLLLPKFEMYEEGSQIRRSSKSACTMIVEGLNRRRYKVDLIKFLVHAHAECDETKLHLEFLFETDSWTNNEDFEKLHQAY